MQTYSIVDANGAALVPTGLNVEVTLNVFISDSGTNQGIIQSPDATDVAASVTTGACNAGADGSGDGDVANGSQIKTWTNTSGQITHRWLATADAIEFGIVGFMDRRGRDD